MLRKTYLESDTNYHIPSIFELQPNRSIDYSTAFITGLSNIYLFQNLGTEIFAAIQSKASRSEIDLRFELDKHMQSMVTQNPKFAELIKFLRENPSEQLTGNVQVVKMLSKFLVEYGHESIAKMANTQGVISRLTLLSAIKFHKSRFYQAIQNSTRYVDTSKFGFFIDPKLRTFGLEKEFDGTIRTILDLYTDSIKLMTNLLVDKYKTNTNITEFMINKKVLDTLRVMIPLCSYTQLSFNANALNLRNQVARFAISDLGEQRQLAFELYEELVSQSPALFSNIDRELLSLKEGQRRSELVANFTKNIFNPTSAKVGSVQLIDCQQNMQDLILMSIIGTENNLPYRSTFEQVRKLGSKVKAELLNKLLGDRVRGNSVVSRALENSTLIFEIVSGFHTYKDISRHNTLTFQHPNGYRTDLGLDYSPTLEKKPFKTIKSNVLKASELASKIYEKISRFDTNIAQYAVLQGHKQRYLVEGNMRAFLKFLELRTSSSSAEDVRNIALEIVKVITPIIPDIINNMNIDYNEYEFPRPNEEREVMKRLLRLEEN